MKTTIFYAIALLAAMQLQAQAWTTGTAMPEPVRAGNTASYSKNGDGYLFVVSGRNADGNITMAHQRYQLSTNSWTILADHPTGIMGASTVIVKDTLYSIGGVVTTPGVSTRKVHKYNINENTWSLGANYPINTADTDAVAYQDSLIYVAAGYSNKVRMFNTITNEWRNATQMTPASQSISWGALSVKNDTLVYMCGADGFQSANYYNTVRIGVIDQNDRGVITWSEATPFPGATRTFFDACTWDNGIIMTGGSTDNTFGTFSDECYLYNAGTDTWTQLPAKPTPWLTGNSGSILVNGEWKLLCSAGFAADYLSQTEILSQSQLSLPEHPNCGLANFRVISGPLVAIEFCNAEPDSITCNIRDVNGRAIKPETTFLSQSGIQRIALDTEGLPQGIYLCTIKQKNQVITKKIVIR